MERHWYCEAVKNITVSLDDELYRRARMIAAERDTSVSALVKDFLSSLGAGESEVDRLKREEREIRNRITTFRASDKISRDELHDRRL
jgi:predicted transcriptional regulator